MSIFHIVDTHGCYGPGLQLRSLLEPIANTGIEQSVCSLYRNSEWTEKHSAQHQSVKFIELEATGTLATNALFRFVQLLRRSNPEAIHLWLDSIPLWIRKCCQWFANARLIWHCEQFNQLQDITRNSARHIELVVPSLRDKLETKRNSKGTITELPKARIGKSGPQEDLKRDITHRIGARTDDKLVATVADLVPGSRIKDLIWATDLLQCIRDDVHLCVLGVGRQMERLKKFATQASVGRKVHFLRTEYEVHELLSVADLYWASDSSRILPDGLLAAMQSRVPVIASDCHANLQLIEDQFNGLIVRTGARDDFARKANQVLKHSCEYDSLCREAEKTVEPFVMRNQNLEKYVQLDPTVVEQSRAA